MCNNNPFFTASEWVQGHQSQMFIFQMAFYLLEKQVMQ